jgi:hypothetical protein
MKTLYFYVLKDPLTLEIKYVGRTVNISVRYRQHIHSGRCEGKKDKKGSWIKSLLNKNLKPVMDIIEVHETYEINFIKNREMELIAEYSKTCDLKNQRDLVDNGYEFSEESRQKMSNSQKGNTNKKGKTLNAEQRHNCGNGRRGKPSGFINKLHSDVTKDKMKKAWEEREPDSEETRIKKSNAVKEIWRKRKEKQKILTKT